MTLGTDELVILLRFRNMDMALSEAMQYRMKNIKQSIWYYDIMCQYWIHLVARFEANPHLHFPEHIAILRAIGLFHVHGHQDECFAKFAPSYIPGAGLVDGEILETLWAVLNHVSGSTRSQATSFRRETLDAHMNDSNWKKLVSQGIITHLTYPLYAWPVLIFLSVHRLVSKWPKAKALLSEAQEALDAIASTAPPESLSQWAKDEHQAQSRRWDDPDVMQIYDIKVNKGMGCHHSP